MAALLIAAAAAGPTLASDAMAWVREQLNASGDPQMPTSTPETALAPAAPTAERSEIPLPVNAAPAS